MVKLLSGRSRLSRDELLSHCICCKKSIKQKKPHQLVKLLSGRSRLSRDGLLSHCICCKKSIKQKKPHHLVKLLSGRSRLSRDGLLSHCICCKKSIKQKKPHQLVKLLSGRQDSNLRPPGPKPGAITGLRYAPKSLLLFAKPAFAKPALRQERFGGRRRRGRDSNPRYKFKLVQRFSKPALSATQAPLLTSPFS